MGHAQFETEDKTLIGVIQQAVETKPIDVDGQTFLTRPIHEPPTPHLASNLTIHTLTGVADYLNNDAQIDAIVPPKSDAVSQQIVATEHRGLAIHVVSETQVQIIRNLTPRFRQREVL